jgi:hypothetical protein
VGCNRLAEQRGHLGNLVAFYRLWIFCWCLMYVCNTCRLASWEANRFHLLFVWCACSWSLQSECTECKFWLWWMEISERNNCLSCTCNLRFSGVILQ